jgi:hypothetical protein
MSGNLKGKLKVHAVKNKKTRFFYKKKKNEMKDYNYMVIIFL